MRRPGTSRPWSSTRAESSMPGPAVVSATAGPTSDPGLGVALHRGRPGLRPRPRAAVRPGGSPCSVWRFTSHPWSGAVPRRPGAPIALSLTRTIRTPIRNPLRPATIDAARRPPHVTHTRLRDRHASPDPDPPPHQSGAPRTAAPRRPPRPPRPARPAAPRKPLISADQRRELSGIGLVGLGVLLAVVLALPGGGSIARPVHDALLGALGIGAWLIAAGLVLTGARLLGQRAWTGGALAAAGQHPGGGRHARLLRAGLLGQRRLGRPAASAPASRTAWAVPPPGP